jgi:hypothetical protein
MEQDNFIIGSFYTEGTPYKEIYEQYLKKSCDKWQLANWNFTTKNYHNWTRNVAEKPRMIETCLALAEDVKKPLVFLDVDCTLEKYPHLFNEIPDEYEIGFHTLNWNCIDENTEILTKKGWKTNKTINQKDIVLNFNIKTNKIEEDKINKIFVTLYEGTMLSLKTSRTDRLITPNHREVFRKRNGKIKIDTVDKILWQEYLYNAAPDFSSTSKTKFIDEELKLLAWI